MAFTEKRPTSVTVIGWLWIILGGMNSLSGVFVLFYVVLAVLNTNAKNMPDGGFTSWLLIPLLLTQCGGGVLCLISAIKFLQLKSWARTVLEGLTWLLLTGIVVQGCMQLMIMIPTGSNGSDILGTGIVIMTGMITLFYLVPVVIMLKSLRGQKIRNAVAGMPNTAESANDQMPDEPAGDRLVDGADSD